MRVPVYIRHPEIREYYQIEWMKILMLFVGSMAIASLPILFGFQMTTADPTPVVPSEATLWQEVGTPVD
jgi:hypothetical protein